ncbi:MAG: TIGR02680 family protein [Microthrixaceae bacterium]|nr:TIGR02680 family protein [Microthrixaceae bacterium]
MSSRWTLNRAGILNVYQYGDEVLDFAGGRLLLRGVNGSGKSTAMNMILPFLLEADVRRIDAAGEQRGVLASWMLSGRDEQQPIGYLWVEFKRDDDYIVCGCGIRANQSTQKVKNWWFITTKRPGIDFSLVEGNVPLSADGLGFALGAGSVFPHEQRQAYRREVRSRLFGGADLDQHFTLLHVVRNPRVGDKIDAELHGYLNDALPQLSEAAIEDAAQPLEDLEEHRRNVSSLNVTASALDALSSVYRSYVRTDLRGRAEEAVGHLDAVRQAERGEKKARQHHESTSTKLNDARGALAALRVDEERLNAEIDAMRGLPAYTQGKDLEDLRERVKALRKAVIDAESRQSNCVDRSSTAADSAGQAQQRFTNDLSDIENELSQLRSACAACGVAAQPPDVPAVEISDRDGVTGPARPFDSTVAEDALTRLITALGIRRGDVAVVREALSKVASAANALELSEGAKAGADAQLERGRTVLGNARSQLAQSLESFRSELMKWVNEAGQTATASGYSLDLETTGIESPDLLDARSRVRGELLGSVEGVLDQLRSTRASLESRLHDESDKAEQLATELAELESRTEPEVPLLGWQTPSDTPVLSQLVDFADGLDDSTRSGLEAALEAAGLLGATVSTEGLRAEDGELLVTANGDSSAVGSPLSDYLTVTIPESVTTSIEVAAVANVLNAISTDLGSSATTVVTPGGLFRVGLVEGRHCKDTSEYIGATARAATLERRRSQVREELVEATTKVASTRAEIDVASQWIGGVIDLRDSLPSAEPLDRAQAELHVAEEQIDQLQESVDQAASEVTRREGLHADALDDARRQATTLSLPHTGAGLDEIEVTLNEAGHLISATKGNLNTLSRSCDGWSDAAQRWRSAIADSIAADAEVDAKRSEHEPVAMRLATLEDSLGVAYEEIIKSIEASESELAATRDQIPSSDKAVESALLELARARAAVETAERAVAQARLACVAQLPLLRSALGVPGVTAAVREPVDVEGADSEVDDTDSDTDTDNELVPPATVESVDGVRTLAEFILAEVPPPASPTTADGVRQSLRLRRDTLGAGWDAEDRQPDESLPVQVEVNGPIGRMPLPNAASSVREQLNHQASLLSAKQDQALRNLLQGLIATEVATKLHAASELVKLMNKRLGSVSTSHGIGASLRWRRRSDIDEELARAVDKMSKPPDMRSDDENAELAATLSSLLENARRDNPDSTYRQLIAEVLDYRVWHEMTVLLNRPGQGPERLTKRTGLSEGEKKVVSYLPLFAAVAASYDALGEFDSAAPRFVLLDDAFAKVSEDNHPKLFGLLVELDLDFIATSERLWGTHASVPELSIIEVVRDAGLGAIVLERARWDGHDRVEVP